MAFEKKAGSIKILASKIPRHGTYDDNFNRIGNS
ncbi:toxin C-terminal domain-containing protein [Pseudomonas kairouanensis]